MRGVTTRVAKNASGLSFGPVSARAAKPYARTGRIQPCWNAIAATARTATTPATSRAEVSLTGFGNEKSLLNGDVGRCAMRTPPRGALLLSSLLRRRPRGFYECRPAERASVDRAEVRLP